MSGTSAGVSLEASIIIPTYNRSHSLARALRSLSELDFPRDQWEVVVVDNNSTDDTKQIAQAARSSMASDLNIRECLEHRLDAVYLQKVSAVFSGQLRRQRWPAVAKSTQIGLLWAEISHLVADGHPKSGRDFFDVIWAAKHSLNMSK